MLSYTSTALRTTAASQSDPPLIPVRSATTDAEYEGYIGIVQYNCWIGQDRKLTLTSHQLLELLQANIPLLERQLADKSMWVKLPSPPVQVESEPGSGSQTLRPVNGQLPPREAPMAPSSLPGQRVGMEAGFF
jgi:hypothetical protein